ncbi:MAG TPA: HypC/HybG/HupF family hydrogenase formation chaperone [Acidimicrobiia bacterium]|nr:HypC/HybG/HupF family hydrogenase formation chaperone [Acidimicrobiia bacterium]
MTVPECHGEVCITCGDVAVPVTVVEIRAGDLALVDTGASLEEISVALVDTRVGGRVLVHAKEAIAVLPDDGEDEVEAKPEAEADGR